MGSPWGPRAGWYPELLGKASGETDMEILGGPCL